MEDKTLKCKCCYCVVEDGYIDENGFGVNADFMIHETIGDNWRDEVICAKCVNEIGMYYLDRVTRNQSNGTNTLYQGE